MSPEIEARILAAAARVYAQYGFRGATTRRIASEAGVNEVTLFRIFGSKAKLLQAMLVSQVVSVAVPVLPADVSDPHAVLTRWCAVLLHYLRGHADLIRKTIAEADERPDAALAACEGPSAAAESLVLYVELLRDEGLADADLDVDTPISMFMSAMFGDALYRDIMPNAFPQPQGQAPSKYVQTFLRGVGLRALPLPARSRQTGGAGPRRGGR
ncbi:MAG: TetR family transcriptional regulator [Gemmatimonadaceae bacterium]